MNSSPRTNRFPTAAQVAAQTADQPSPPPGMVLSVYPPTIEHLRDPLWYNSAGQDPIQQRHIFDRCHGKEQKEKLKEVLDEFPNRGRWVLNKAAEQGYPNAIVSLLDLGVSLASGDGGDQVGDANFAPLHTAAFFGHLECVKDLIEKGGIGVEARDHLDTTPLFNAATGGHLSIVQWLLERGADPGTQKYGNSIDILQRAAASGNTDVFRTMLDARRNAGVGIDLDHVISYGASSGNVGMLKLILEQAGFPVDGDKAKGKTRNGQQLTDEQVKEFERGLWRASAKTSLPCLYLLLSYVTGRNRDDSFQYYECKDKAFKVEIFNTTIEPVEKDNTEWFEIVWNLFLSPPQSVLDSNPEAKALQQEWLHRRLITAAGAGALNMTKLLLEKYKADVNHISIKYHATPLFNAAAQGHVEVVRYLLESHNADIHLGNGSYANGPTALHNTILNGLEEVVKLLLKHGGPVESFDEAIGSTTGKRRHFVVAFKKYRAPVELLDEEQEEQRREEIKSRGRALELAVDEADMSWIELLQVRRRDERLKDDGRELMTIKDAEGNGEDKAGENQDGRPDNEPSVKRVRRLGWLESMGLEPVE
jgi:ankyrin repeat protein